MNNYIITYDGTDKQYKDVMCGMTANTAREAIIDFYKKYLAPLCFSASNGCIYNLYGEAMQTGDDWIAFGNGRFTAKLADDQPKETPVEGLQQEVERLKAENDRLKSYKKECQRLQAEVDRLKSCIERQQEQTTKGTTGMLKTIQDLYKYSQENDAIVYEKYRKLKDDYDQKVEHLNLLKDENQSYKSIIKALVFAFGLTALGICIYIKTL